MCGCAGECGYELLSERLRLLEAELDQALAQRDTARVTRLRARIVDMRAGCSRLLQAVA